MLPEVLQARGEDGGHVVLLEGTAQKGDTAVLFRAAATASDGTAAGSAAARPTVEGCPFLPADVTTDGTVTVRVAIGIWLDQVDFGAAPASDGATPVDLGATAAGNAFRRGLQKSSAYAFSFTAP